MSKARKISKDKNKDPLNLFEGREGLVYARVSSKRQETDGSGLQSQEGRCIKELNYLKVSHVKTFSDSFTGGGDDFMRRPAMRDLMNYIDAHPHKKYVVVFDDLKRFARDREGHFKLKAAFIVRDVELKCLNYNFDDSPEGLFTETIFAAQGQLEREQNKRQVIQKQKARLDLGFWAFASKKGYKMTKTENGPLSIINKDGEILKEALEKFANGTFPRKIDACIFLVEQGFWTKQKPERYIDKFDAILKDPFYAGFIEYSVWEVSRREGRHQGLISPETFDLIQKRLGKFDLGKNIRKDISDDFQLRGLLVCADCGKHLTAAWSKGRNKKHPYYFCQNDDCESDSKVIRRDLIEDGFNDILKNTTLKNDISKVVIVVFDRVWDEEIKNSKKSESILGRRKNEIENQIRDITSLILNSKSEYVRSSYEKQIESLGKEVEEIESNIPIGSLDLEIPYRTALEKATGLLKSPYSIWVNLSTKEKQDLFYFIFPQKLAYSRKDGYRTDETPSVVRLFESFTTQKPRLVDTKQNLTNLFIPLLEFVRRWGSV